MRRATKRCTFPGCTEVGAPTRCQRHERQDNAGRHRTTPTKVARQQPGVRTHRKTAVEAHVEQHGWRCLGDSHHAAHDTRDLVADDPVPIARGGDPMQPLKVMCRSANSRLGMK